MSDVDTEPAVWLSDADADADDADLPLFDVNDRSDVHAKREQMLKQRHDGKTEADAHSDTHVVHVTEQTDEDGDALESEIITTTRAMQALPAITLAQTDMPFTATTDSSNTSSTSSAQASASTSTSTPTFTSISTSTSTSTSPSTPTMSSLLDSSTRSRLDARSAAEAELAAHRRSDAEPLEACSDMVQVIASGSEAAADIAVVRATPIITATVTDTAGLPVTEAHVTTEHVHEANTRTAPIFQKQAMQGQIKVGPCHVMSCHVVHYADIMVVLL